MEHQHVSYFAEPSTWVVIAFVAFFAIFGRKLWGALAAILDGRAAEVRTQLEEAARLRAEAEAMLKDAQARREAALQEAQAMLDRAREEAAQAGERARAETEASSRRRERMAHERIQAAETAAVADVRRAAAEVATQAATQILRGDVGGDVDAALVDRSIAGLPAALAGRRAA